jgi:hypothetical protein
MAKSNVIRLSLDLTPEMKQIVDTLAEISGITQSEVLRRSIGLLKLAKEGEKKGESLALVKNDRVVAKLVGI